MTWAQRWGPTLRHRNVRHYVVLARLMVRHFPSGPPDETNTGTRKQPGQLPRVVG